MSKGKDIYKEMLQTIMDESKMVGDKVYTELVEKAHEINTRLPEEIFVRNFLPYFAGKVQSDQSQQILASWISIAGTPMAEVTIVDNSNTPLYNVPGVFDTSFLAVKSSADKNNFAAITDHMRLLENHIPTTARNFGIKALNEKFEEIVQTPVTVQENEQRWMNIFKRYNLGVEQEKEKQDTQQQVNQNISDDEIYD